ncbi:membrane protein [Planctomycetota bacterium]|nr:membrane protein [Planctomycetota bacterium]
MLDWLFQLHDPDHLRHLVATAGLVALVAIVFAETGIFAGFFLPGDSLLIAAGVFTALDPSLPDAAPLLDFVTTGTALTVAAIAGNQVNWWIGWWIGGRAWAWPDGRLFKRRYLEDAKGFYDRWGGLALVAGRFIPIARTFIPFVAGVARMPFGRYLLWNVLGALVWVWSLLALGHWLGNSPLREQLHLLLVAVVVLSFVPVAIAAILRWRSTPPAQ